MAHSLESNLNEDIKHQRKAYSRIQKNLVTAFAQTALAVTLYTATQFLAPASLQKKLDKTPVDEAVAGLAIATAIGVTALHKNRKPLRQLRNAKGIMLSNHGLVVAWPAGEKQVERAIVRKDQDKKHLDAILQKKEERHRNRWDRFLNEATGGSAAPAP